MAIECSICSRPDFASGLRCQWCGTHFNNGVASASIAPASIAPAASVALNGSTPADNLMDDGDLVENTTPISDEAKKGDWKEVLKKTWGWLLILFAFLGKAKGLLVLFKFGKFFTTGLSMLVSIAVYAMFFGWKFAVGFVVLILIHEMGHVLVIRAKGLEASAPIFIPMLGAAIFLKKRPEDPLTDAQISYGGPLLGTVGAIACYLVYLQTQHPIWMALAHVGFFLNLFNLVPATPLDGGWIVKAISPKLWLVGAVVGVVVAFLIHSVLLGIISVFSVINAWGVLKHSDDDPEDEYDENEAAPSRVPQMTPRARLVVTACYIGLIAFLGGSLSHTTHALEKLRENHIFDRQAAHLILKDRPQ